MAEVKRMKYCVGGEWKESVTDKYMEITDSSTGEVIAEVPQCTPDEVRSAIDAAQEAFESWSRLSIGGSSASLWELPLQPVSRAAQSSSGISILFFMFHYLTQIRD